ncbi:MAG TPA: amidohydrolase family protein [Thermoanaerobaculia bacterium]
MTTVIATCSLSLASPLPAESESDRRPVLVRNAGLILTMDPQLGTGPLGIIEGGDVLFDRTGILAVGKDLQAQDAEVLDATNRIVMPGFVNLHDHLFQTGIRGCGSDKDVNGWLTQCVRPLERLNLSEEEVYALVRLSTLGVISTGITTTVDWSSAFTPQFVRGDIRALADSGLRFVFAYRGTRSSIEDIRRVKRELIDPNPLARLQVGSHLFNQLDVNAMTQLARELGVMLHVHLLENISQRQEGQITALQTAGAFGPSLLVAHAIHLTDEEVGILAANDVRVAHNPLSNMRLASGVIRFPELRGGGIKVGLGLDGGTNDTADMFNDMRVAVGLQRATTLSASAYPTIGDVLRLATMGGAEALDMADQIGSLTPGKRADLIVIDPSGINFAARFDWVSQIVLNGQPANVEWVFIDGQARKANGRLVGVNAEKLVESAEVVTARIRAGLQ